jgi:hypothetical protein
VLINSNESNLNCASNQRLLSESKLFPNQYLAFGRTVI